jgi:hypothetical protein
MAFDLEYILTECDHRIHDELLFESVITSNIVASDAARFGSSFFGRSRFGYTIFYLNDRYGASGQFFDNPDGTVTAVFPLVNKIAGSPKLFYKLPSEYLRHPLSQYTSTEYGIPYYGTLGIYYGVDTDYYLGGLTEVPSDSTSSANKLWFIAYEPMVYNGYNIPANSIVITRFNNEYTWLLDYTVVMEECPYCEGTGIKNDLKLSPIGRLKLVADMDKLMQQVIKAIITSKGKNIFFPSYGTIIPQAIGSRGLNGFILREEIYQQLSMIAKNQQDILNMNSLFFTAGEVLHDLIGVQVQPSADPRQINLLVTIQNKASEMRTSKTFKVG